MAHALLDRYGIVTRGAVAAEGIPGGFAAVYRVLSALEDAGTTRRGYFIEGLGAAQFASPGAVDQLRFQTRKLNDSATEELVVLSACDPANPYGASLPWPPSAADSTGGHRPGRKAGSLVVLRNGQLSLYFERGGKTVLGFSDDPQELTSAFDAIAAEVRRRRIGALTVQRYNGGPVGTSEAAIPMESAGFTLTPRGMRVRPN